MLFVFLHPVVVAVWWFEPAGFQMFWWCRLCESTLSLGGVSWSWKQSKWKLGQSGRGLREDTEMLREICSIEAQLGETEQRRDRIWGSGLGIVRGRVTDGREKG